MKCQQCEAEMTLCEIDGKPRYLCKTKYCDGVVALTPLMDEVTGGIRLLLSKMHDSSRHLYGELKAYHTVTSEAVDELACIRRATEGILDQLRYFNLRCWTPLEKEE